MVPLGALYPTARWRSSTPELVGLFALAQSLFGLDRVSLSPSPVDIRTDLGELSSEHLLHVVSSQRRLRDLPVPVAPRRAPCRRTWIPAGTSFNCRYVTECPSLASRIACAIFAVDFSPLSRLRRGNTSAVKQEVNKATVPQLISELKQVQNGVTTAKSSVADRLIESM